MVAEVSNKMTEILERDYYHHEDVMLSLENAKNDPSLKTMIEAKEYPRLLPY